MKGPFFLFILGLLTLYVFLLKMIDFNELYLGDTFKNHVVILGGKMWELNPQTFLMK